MGKSPGKWIKTVLFGKKSSRSGASKGREALELGRVEADFGRFDVKTVVRNIYILFSKSEIPIAREDQEIMDLVDPATPLPPWFTDDDLTAYATLYEKSGFRLPLRVPYRSGQLHGFPSFSNHHHLFYMSLIGPFEKLPDVHEFPPKLTELILRGSQLEQDQIGTLEMLPNLRKLSLLSKSYIGKEMVCSVGGFPLLDYLYIYELDELEEWRVEEGAMRNLRHLEISGCKKMKMLPDGLRHISTLQDLQLRSMPEEFKVRVRKDDGEDWFKIRHVPSLTIMPA